MVYLQVSSLGGSHDEVWRGQGTRKRSVSWNFPKLSQMWWCNRDFRPSTTQNQLWAKQLMNGTRNTSRVAACALWNEAISWDYQAYATSILSRKDICEECARHLTETPAIHGLRDVLTSEGSWQKFLTHIMFCHDCPLAVICASTPWCLFPKQTWRDSVPIDMCLSSVCLLVVVLPSSEVLEGLRNYPVFNNVNNVTVKLKCLKSWYKL
jgi:hypothetical protein